MPSANTYVYFQNGIVWRWTLCQTGTPGKYKALIKEADFQDVSILRGAVLRICFVEIEEVQSSAVPTGEAQAVLFLSEKHSTGPPFKEGVLTALL